MRWVVGGPAYRMEMRVEHGCMLARLAGYLSVSREPLSMRYAHTSVLPEGRAAFLKMAVDGEFDVALGVDTDTWIKDVGHVVSLSEAFLGSRDVAMVGVLVPQRDGRVNGWADEGRRFAIDEVEPFQLVDAWAVGAALCLYNLDWYRHRCDVDPRSMYATVPTPDHAFMGEDVWHCRAVARQGGRVQAVRLPGVRHAGGL